MATQLVERAGARFAMRCWGDFAIESADGDDLRPRGRKGRGLLAFLALHPDRRVSRERLMALLWGDRAEDQARSSLRQTLFELKAFGNGAGLIAVERDAVTLHGAALRTDVDAIAAACAAADHEALLAALPDPDETMFANLDGLDAGFDEWLQGERTRRRDELVQMIGDASAQAVATGATRAARALHARLLAFDPGHEQPAPAGDATITLPAEVLPPVQDAARPNRRGLLICAGAVVLAGGAGAWLTSRPPGPGTEALNLVEAADAILYARDSKNLPAAIDLYRRAMALEPGHAPARAGLASAIVMGNRTPEARMDAERLARQAIALDPRSGKAHGVLGMVLDFASPEARAAVKRAAALDPRDPEIQFWLSQVLFIEGDFGGRLDALRRSAAIDPLWHRASGFAALAAWELGFEREAEQHAARLRQADLARSFDCGYALDCARGDYAAVVRQTIAVRQELKTSDVDGKLGLTLLVLGHVEPAKLLLGMPPPLWRVASDAGLAAGELGPFLDESLRDGRANLFALTALRQAVRDGRHAEVVAAYDVPSGRLNNLSSDDAPNAARITEGLQVALSLRALGRDRDASFLLGRADAAIRRSSSLGAVPNWMHAGAASVWAVQGRTDEAIVALATAVARGWHYAPMTPLPDMSDIPSFASLHGNPRFETLRGRLREQIERERRALGPVPI